MSHYTAIDERLNTNVTSREMREQSVKIWCKIFIGSKILVFSQITKKLSNRLKITF